MARRLILDTGILVGMERGELSDSVLQPDDDVSLSMVVVSEYMAGIELAQPDYRSRMQKFLDNILDMAIVLPFDEEILDTHVRLFAWTYRHGCIRGQHDLIIAATAIVTGRILLTRDRKARFEELPEISVELMD